MIGVEVHVSISNSRSCFKHKNRGKPKYEQQGDKKHGKRTNLAKVKRFNCNQMGHYACDCTKYKKMLYYAHASDFNVAGFFFLFETNPIWIIDSGATDHIARDREAFLDFQCVPWGLMWIHMGNR